MHVYSGTSVPASVVVAYGLEMVNDCSREVAAM